MAIGRDIGLVITGLIAGGIVGGLIGLCAGLAHTQLTNVTGFEGYSGFVVAYWILAGGVFGTLFGLFFTLRRARR